MSREGQPLNRSIEMISQKLYQLEQVFWEEQDELNAEKTGQLNRKWNKGEFVLAFCGHFSAGKSTMINTLIGKEILPSSPIPTSANVVKIKSGKAHVMVYFKDRVPARLDYGKDLDRVRELCQDGDEVVSIEIFHPNDFLVNGACLLDTPGIDSTDSAHKLATESAIYLADAVVYMMDYNHVQAEVNFQFTKTLKEKGKTLFLVINQIDKHFELELAFSNFAQGVKDAFQQWGVGPDAIFYTSLKLPSHPENQLVELHDHLYSLFWKKEQLLQESVIQSALDLIQEHERFIKGKSGQQKEAWMEIIGEGNQAEIKTSYAQVLEQLEQIQKRPLQLRDEVKKDILNVIENANITPFSMRDLAAKYLESSQPGFKVGFLFSVKKTEQEKEKRLQQFHEEVERQVKANLEWHVREILQRVPKVYSLTIPAEWQEKIDCFQIPISPELLVSQIKQGARMTGEAILNYCRDLATEIKSRYRRSGMILIEEYVRHSEKEAKEEETLLLEKSKDIGIKIQAIGELSALEERESRYIQELKNDWLNIKGILEDPICQEGEEKQIPVSRLGIEKTLPSIVQKGTVKSLEINRDQELVFASHQDFKGKLIQTAESLRKAARLIEGLRGQSLAAREMIQRANRLEQNLFTVALFGAFSAGKSSFANAMMGEMVLPVSPNPTTATINKILPPTAEFPHGSVRVKIKNEREMLKEVVQSLQVFRLQADTIEEAVTVMRSVHVEQLLATAKPHYSFLKAVDLGLERMKGLFGQELLVGIDEFKDLVAVEEKACFVEWIELYYSCPVTDQGISLVDTPGADSIHARHTGVAFDYMKSADAVLFVTYYNHAFSHADREFLQQLGRVKDIFELDKMFFLVNAADLARSEDELLDVVEHVKQNLHACGIRYPRLYPVSSQTALLARMYGSRQLTGATEELYRERTRSKDQLMAPDEALSFSGFLRFEHDFIQFTMKELTEIAVGAANGEIHRSIHAIGALIETTKEGEEQRKLRLTNASASKTADTACISTCAIERELGQLRQEIEELLYYVKQRLFFRFQELFSLSFNPAVIKEGKGKEVLPLCLDDLLRNIELTLRQEIQTTSLLVEKTSEKFISEIFQKMMKQLKVDMALSYRELQWEIPVFNQPLKHDRDSAKRILKQFKSPKQFFEQGGRETMRQQLENWVYPLVSDYLDKCMNQLGNDYGSAFEHHMQDLKLQWQEQTEEYYDGLLGALEEKLTTQQLESILGQLESLV